MQKAIFLDVLNSEEEPEFIKQNVPLDIVSLRKQQIQGPLMNFAQKDTKKRESMFSLLVSFQYCASVDL